MFSVVGCGLANRGISDRRSYSFFSVVLIRRFHQIDLCFAISLGFFPTKKATVAVLLTIIQPSAGVLEHVYFLSMPTNDHLLIAWYFYISHNHVVRAHEDHGIQSVWFQKGCNAASTSTTVVFHARQILMNELFYVKLFSKRKSHHFYCPDPVSISISNFETPIERPTKQIKNDLTSRHCRM